MSSPITFSNFNGIDFNTVLTALMAQASQPLTALQTEQSNLNSQNTNYGSLETQVSNLVTAANALSDPTQLTTTSASSSDSTAVSATSGPGATPGTYAVIVQTLAHAQVTAAATTAPDANTTTVATGGSLTIGGVTVNLSGPVTLQGLASAINSTAGIGVTASVVQAGANSYRLVLTSNTTGAASAFTIQNSLTGGIGVTFPNANNDGNAGDNPADNAVNASDATLLVNNVQVESASNTISGAIPGVTLNALQANPNSSVTVTVNTDGSSLETSINSFISGYNSLASFISSQNTSANNGDQTSIGQDSLLHQLTFQLDSAISQAYAGGTFTNLSQVGIEFTQTGTLQFNQATFNSAMASDPSGVAAIFSGTSGAFTNIGSVLTNYSQPAGIIATTQTSITQQSSNLNSQIAAMQQRLSLQQASLQAEFTAADAAMASLQGQSSYLSSLGVSLSSSTLSQNG